MHEDWWFWNDYVGLSVVAGGIISIDAQSVQFRFRAYGVDDTYQFLINGKWVDAHHNFEEPKPPPANIPGIWAQKISERVDKFLRSDEAAMGVEFGDIPQNTPDEVANAMSDDDEWAGAVESEGGLYRFVDGKLIFRRTMPCPEFLRSIE